MKQTIAKQERLDYKVASKELDTVIENCESFDGWSFDYKRDSQYNVVRVGLDGIEYFEINDIGISHAIIARMVDAYFSDID